MNQSLLHVILFFIGCGLLIMGGYCLPSDRFSFKATFLIVSGAVLLWFYK